MRVANAVLVPAAVVSFGAILVSVHGVTIATGPEADPLGMLQGLMLVELLGLAAFVGVGLTTRAWMGLLAGLAAFGAAFVPTVCLWMLVVASV